MRSSTAKKLVVVSIVSIITAICVIAVATVGSEGYRRVTEVSVSSEEAPDSAGAEVSAPQDARRLEVEKAITERSSKTARPAATPSPSPDRAAIEGKSVPAASDKNELDVLGSAFLGEPARSISAGRSAAAQDESASPDTKSAAERDRMDRDLKRLNAEMLRRMDVVANRLKLDQYQRESITQIVERTLQQIRGIREQFINSQMAEYDMQLMRSQIRDAYRTAGENIKYALGDEKYKEFRKDSAYYKNPDSRRGSPSPGVPASPR